MKRKPPCGPASALFRQFAAAARNGLPLVEVARIMGEEWQSTAGRGGGDIALFEAALARGAALSVAMEEAPRLFAVETKQWVRLAESKGELGATLDTLADDMEHLSRVRSALRMAMAWPLFLALVIGVVWAVLAITVMPAIEEVYTSFNVELHALTVLVFAVSNAAALTWWIWVPPLVVLALLYELRKIPDGLAAACHALLYRLRFVARLSMATLRAPVKTGEML